MKDLFVDLLGDERVSWEPDVLAGYGADMTENPPRRPDVVVRPRTADDVAAIVRIAATERIPVTPAVARMNVGGLAIPSDGGIVVDLSDLDRIDAIERDDMYAVIEPGVTYGQMTEALARAAPGLTISYPLSPPHTSIAANCLLDGLGSLSLPHGSHADHIGGVEAVLPDGTVVRTGACAVSDKWFGRGPLPDLTGLFVNWHGTSGIVTKLAVQLWPAPRLSRRLFVFCGELTGSFALVRDLALTGLCRDLSGITWPTGKMVFGVDDPGPLDAGEPEIFVYFEFGADDDAGMRYKERTLRRVVDRHRRAGLPVQGVLSIDDLVAVAPALARFTDFPMTLDFLLDHPGGGLTWVGTYGPWSAWEEGARRCRDLMVARGFPPILVTRPMKGGHFAVLRMITCFDRSDEDEIARVRDLNAVLLDVCLDLGFIPYKAPDWAIRALAGRTDPGFKALFTRVRDALDPHRIMNPERLPFGE